MKANLIKRIGQSFLANVLALALALCCTLPSNADTTNEKEVSNETIEITDLPFNATAGVSAELLKILVDTNYQKVDILAQTPVLVGTGLDEAGEEEAEEEPIETLSYTPVEVPYTMYVGGSVLRERSTPNRYDDGNIIASLTPGTVLTVIGTRDDEWVAIQSSQTESGVAYVSGEYIQDTSPEEATYNWDWSGETLNSLNGRVSGPSGSETYYNLDMSYIVERLHRLGYEGDYWVRSDGTKMFGDYVMVAADFSIRPIGTTLPTTLGTGIVCDTGDFIYSDSTGIDIATTWD